MNAETVQAAAYGGAVLGGGGGGPIEEGLRLGRLALELGRPRLVTLDELDDDAVLVTVALVGAPSATEQYLEPMYLVRALELLMAHLDRPVAGLITNENGGMATLNGWLQSAITGRPVVDAPCNGRAHPTGLMGAMGLDAVPGYLARQAAVGGNPDAGRHLRLYVEGGLTLTARLVRQAAVEAGGLVAVARSPVTVDYARQHAAPGAVGQAIEVGRALLGASIPIEAAEAVCRVLGGQLICQALVRRVALRSEGGFDVGQVALEDGYELTFWNEYMTLERRGERLATFPDLIATLSATEPRPLTSAEIRQGQELLVIRAPKERLRLGAGMRRPELFRVAEEAVGKEIIRYVFAGEAA
ncbi:MAG: DUF917 family protein [Anaerolineae bacterium]|nr:DUF917 family protein [Anaerolineae bacterium]